MLVEIPIEAIEKFIKWNALPFKQNEVFDKKIVFALLFICVDDEKILAGLVHDDVKQFIKGIDLNLISN